MSADRGPDITDQQANRDTLATWFKSHPYQEISPEDLEQLVGRNYQQRISDCRTELGLTIENIPKSTITADGKVKRLAGWYRYRPQTAQGRDSTQPNDAWPVDGAPYQETAGGVGRDAGEATHHG